MKNTFTFVFIIILMLSTFSSFAKIWRVNNNPLIPADYRTAQSAADAAAAGDTIFFEPSGGTYGDLNITKKLILIGQGYYLAENGFSRVDSRSATLGTITIRATSQGSVISGLVINIILIQCSNIVIENNFFSNYSVFNNTTDITGVVIRKNHNLSLYHASSIFGTGTGTITNTIIRNNFMGILSLSNGSFQNTLIFNNIFNSNVDIINSVFYNNIFNQGSFSATNSTWSNNISRNSNIGSENNNIINVDISITPLFVGTPTNSDGFWRLHPNSPAKGHGIGGVDCGKFGGDDPYVLSGIVGIPAITSFNASAAGTDDIPIKVTISAVSNK
jgi:hypothetical protein